MPVKESSSYIYRPAARDGVGSLQIKKWEEFVGVAHGFFTRWGGVSLKPYNSLNLSFAVGDDPAKVAENRRIASQALAVGEANLILLRQQHENRILPIAEAPPSPESRLYDGMVTSRRGFALGILSADCLPLLLFDPVKKVIAAGHAGWRGTRLAIAENLVGAMEADFGCRPANITAALGPAIGPCCYRVGKDVRDQFSARERKIGFQPLDKEGNSFAMNLAAINILHLKSSGLPPENIVAIELCTSCRQDLFFSHRGLKGRGGRQLNVIMLK